MRLSSYSFGGLARLLLLCASLSRTLSQGIDVTMDPVPCTIASCSWERQRSVDNTINQMRPLDVSHLYSSGFQSCFTVPYDLNIGRILVPIASNSSGQHQVWARLTPLVAQGNSFEVRHQHTTQRATKWLLNDLLPAPEYRYIKIEFGIRHGVSVSSGAAGVCITVGMLDETDNPVEFTVPTLPVDTAYSRYNWQWIATRITSADMAASTVTAGDGASLQVPLMLHSFVDPSNLIPLASLSPTPSAVPTATASVSALATADVTPSASASVSPSMSPTPSASESAAVTSTASFTATSSGANTPTPTSTNKVWVYTTTTLAGNPGVWGNLDGVGTEAEFVSPIAAAIAPDGTLYVADHSTIRKVLTNGTVTTFVGTLGSAGFANGQGTAAKVSAPDAIVFAPDGTLYMVEQSHYIVRAVSTDGTVTTLAGDVTYGDVGYMDGIGTSALFGMPTGICISPDSTTLFVADTGNCNIRAIIRSTGAVTTFAGSTTGEASSADGTGTDATFNAPGQMTADGYGNIYVFDDNSGNLRKITASGVVSTIGTLAGSGITCTPDGSMLYISGSGHTIQSLTSGGVVSTVAGAAWAHADGVGSSASFRTVRGLVLYQNTTIYVTDSGDHTVRKIVMS